ncbi:MAG: hypothetical protein LBH60_08250 [Prevotellaceae bacterium]|nr:hypothetical protein [Prevotellaceae bacterium]
MRHFVCFLVIMMLFRLSGLNAQDGQNDILQPNDSVDIEQRDSLLLQQINLEDLFRKKIAEIDSSDFDRRKIEKLLKTLYSDYHQWRFGVNGGIELIIAPEAADTSEELLKYRKSLKSGLRLGADAVFYLSPNIGVGVNYSTFGTGNRINHIVYETGENSRYEGKRRDDIRIHFVGPAISIRSIPRHNKIYAFCDFTMGYFIYSNNLFINNTEYKLRKENFGFATSMGADFMIMKNLSAGVSLNITAASVKNVEILTGNKIENLSRISLVLTLKTYR